MSVKAGGHDAPCPYGRGRLRVHITKPVATGAATTGMPGILPARTGRPRGDTPTKPFIRANPTSGDESRVENNRSIVSSTIRREPLTARHRFVRFDALIDKLGGVDEVQRPCLTAAVGHRD